MTDARPGDRGGRALVGSPAWRADVAARQTEVLAGARRVTVTCAAPIGAGGLGRHLEELLAALARRGSELACICEGGSHEGVQVLDGAGRRPLRHALTPLSRLSPALRIWLTSSEFDIRAARLLAGCEQLIGFNGTSLAQLRAARAAGWASVLASATVHARVLVRRHAQARERYPLERSWSRGVLARNLAEYELAQTIQVSSRLSWESFVNEGVPEERLAMFPLSPAERFVPREREPEASTFDVVYAGGLTVDKGVPLLIDAVRRLGHADLRLRLVGGWKTPGMRRFVQAAAAADPRLQIGAADPLAALASARLYVHPAYSDGFGYAPAEAMACGVPVLVSEDTGMKELVRATGAGAVLPTGDLDALAEAIDAAYRGRPVWSAGA